MDRTTARKVRYYIGLHYPLFVTLTDEGFHGTYPDLPGCVAVARDSAELYATMDQVRREWIANRVFAGDEVPLPNVHLKSAAPVAVPVAAPPQAEPMVPEIVETTWVRSVQALA
jgi:predicted RNase H-like HicB family nuclease